MFWSKKTNDKDSNSLNQGKSQTQHKGSCSVITRCIRCGYPVEGLALVCPRCREELPRGCSGNCSSCGT